MRNYSYKKILPNLLLIIRNKFRRVVHADHYLLCPHNLRHDDLYIVEFPKSGITWLSTIITNINLLKTGEDQVPTFFNLNQYIPDIHVSKDIPINPIWEYPKYRFIKSHDKYNPNYKHVIYLIRNPYKVMNSYYSFAGNYLNFKGTFEEFVKSSVYGIDAWCNHVESWLDSSNTGVSMCFIRYEDLLDNGVQEISELYENLGLKVHKEIIEKGFHLSKLKNMSKSENLFALKNPIYESNFINKSKSNHMTDDLKMYMENRLSNNEIYQRYYNND
jgi:hypothetical protein